MPRQVGALAEAVSSAPADATVHWPEEGTKSLSGHLVNLCMHEALHLGQMVAFCYAINVRLPQTVVTMWALSPQDENA